MILNIERLFNPQPAEFLNWILLNSGGKGYQQLKETRMMFFDLTGGKIFF
jgi:hypothetical protein